MEPGEPDVLLQCEFDGRLLKQQATPLTDDPASDDKATAERRALV